MNEKEPPNGWLTIFEKSPSDMEHIQTLSILPVFEGKPMDKPTNALKFDRKPAIADQGAFVGGFRGSKFVVAAWHCGKLIPVWYFDCPFELVWVQEFALANDGLSMAWVLLEETLRGQKLGPRSGVYLQTVDRKRLSSDLKASSYPVKLPTILARGPLGKWWEFSMDYDTVVPHFSADNKLLYLAPTIDGGRGEKLPLAVYDTTPIMYGPPFSNDELGDVDFVPLQLVARLEETPDSQIGFIRGAFLQTDLARPDLVSIKVFGETQQRRERSLLGDLQPRRPAPPVVGGDPGREDGWPPHREHGGPSPDRQNV